MLQEGQEIAGYRLLRKIGEGGMGQVFLADQLRLRRQVAIKLVNLDVKPGAESGDAEPAEELTREATALMALEHPHILSLYDAGREGDLAYLVMPYVPEGSLQEALRPGPRQQLQLPLAPGEALIYVEQAAAALQHAHDRNFIHRDVKPANFLIRPISRSTGSGRGVKRLHLFLADFGLSKFLAYSSNTTHLSGTPTYMAPEQFQGHAVPASDQYALAVLFYYLLTGDLPYRGSPVELMFHHLSDPPPSPAALVKDIPESLASVVQRGMAKTPEERYASVASMAEAAREALIAAGMVPSQDSYPAIAAVRPADLQSEQPRDSKPEAISEQPKGSKPDVALAPTAVLGSSEKDPAATISTDDQATARVPAEVSQPAAPAAPAESSLPTLPAAPQEPRKPTRDEGSSAERGTRRPGMKIALAALIAIVALGAIFGSGLIFHVGPFQTNTPIAQSTRAPTAGPTATSTPGLTPTGTQAAPTQVPPGSILNSILAQKAFYTVDLTQGSGPWDGPTQLNTKAPDDLRTPSGAVRLTNGIITYNAQTFPTPLAIAVDLQAASDQQFYILLDTTNGSGAHLYYRLQLTNNAQPQAAYSSDNHTFTTAGTGASVNTTWTDGRTHTLIFVLDGTRLLFYLDGQSLVDAPIPQPDPSAKLILASLDLAVITGIRAYHVPQAG